MQKTIENGIYVLRLFIDEDIFKIKFDKAYLEQLIKNKRKLFPINIARFFILSIIFFFLDNINYNEIVSYVYQFYNSLVYDVNELNK